MDKRKRRRNRGNIEGIQLPVQWNAETGLPPEQRRVELPDGKEEIEELVARITLRRFDKLAALGKNVQSPYPSEQIARPQREDIDFEFTDGSGDYLELTEFTPDLKQLYGNYDLAPKEYLVGERADEVERILRDDKCSESRYGPDVTRRLHVILYVTDWKMSINDGVVRLLRASFNRERPDVKSIVFFRPSPDESGHVTVIYPHPPEAIDEDTIRQTRIRQGLAGIDSEGHPVVDFGEGSPIRGLRIDRIEYEDTGASPYRLTVYSGDTVLEGYAEHPVRSIQIVDAQLEPDPDDP